jgi:hypothetical protein
LKLHEPPRGHRNNGLPFRTAVDCRSSLGPTSDRHHKSRLDSATFRGYKSPEHGSAKRLKSLEFGVMVGVQVPQPLHR